MAKKFLSFSSLGEVCCCPVYLRPEQIFFKDMDKSFIETISKVIGL